MHANLAAQQDIGGGFDMSLMNKPAVVGFLQCRTDLIEHVNHSGSRDRASTFRQLRQIDAVEILHCIVVRYCPACGRKQR